MYVFFFILIIIIIIFFFFQAEDGIRDGHVTGVQTCALPISIAEGSELSHCGDCGEPLMDHDCDEHGRWEGGYDGNDMANSARYQDHDDAKRWLLREFEEQADNVDSWAEPPGHDCEDLGHENDDSCPRQVANQLSFLAADLTLISQGETFESTVAGVRYWIKEAEA